MAITVLGILPYHRSLKKSKGFALQHIGSNGGNSVHSTPTVDIAGSFITNLQLPGQGTTGKIFMVESAFPGEGKTTVLAKTAMKLAKGGLHVLMVDADLQRPSLHQAFGFKKEGGLTDAMENILSHEITEGDLNTYSMDDLFFLISLKKLSGKLFIKTDSQDMTVVFASGRLLHVESKNNPLANRLGTMLLRGDYITENQLDDALERNQRTGQLLGYILIQEGYISSDKLHGLLKLQMEEYIHKLFSLNQGSFSFHQSNFEACEHEKLYFNEDHTSIIRRLGCMTSSRLLKNEILSHVKYLHEQNLSLLQAGRSHSIPKGAVFFMLIEKILDILKNHFDIVLVDAPPILEEDCATHHCSIIDGVIFVVKSGHLSADVIKQATARLKESNANILGAVLNQVKVGKKYYYKY